MSLDLTTPALLFPAISLLLLAYTNRFLSLSALIRNLHERYLDLHEAAVLSQIKNLRRRVNLIRSMQALGVCSFFGCVFCTADFTNTERESRRYHHVMCV